MDPNTTAQEYRDGGGSGCAYPCLRTSAFEIGVDPSATEVMCLLQVSMRRPVERPDRVAFPHSRAKRAMPEEGLEPPTRGL